MSDRTGRWVITFNGEIYNYRALRSELEDEGCTFATNSDTEVLLNVLVRWGEAGLRKLRGMYAFAAWDGFERELWLVRDPLGIKPLYVAEGPKEIWFASQARPLAAVAPVHTSRDAAALTGFYLWGHVPEPFSWWAGIRMFPAGHVQRIKIVGTASAPRSFSRIEECFIKSPAASLQIDELREALLDTVEHHLVADVPVGVFLSAGIDSGTIAAIASEFTGQLRTVTLGFREYIGTEDDEVPLAEAAARSLRTEHATVRISREEFGGLRDEYLQAMDQPTIDGLNTYLVSRALASQGLKVALSGLGADELFGGYPSFWQIPPLLKWGRLVPPWLSRAFQRTLRAIQVPRMPPKTAGLLSHSQNVGRAYLLRRSLYLEDELDLLLDESWINDGLERLATSQKLAETVDTLQHAGTVIHAQVAMLELSWYTRNQLLRDADWASMAHGVEIRVPYLDMNFIKSLAPAIGAVNPPTKRDLAACAKRLPSLSADRRKTGFTTPVRLWITDNGYSSERGLRGWAASLHQEFRAIGRKDSTRTLPVAAD